VRSIGPRVVLALLLALLSPLGARSAWAQDFGALHGTVLDSEGRPIQGITVRLETKSGLRAPDSAGTDAEGRFRFSGLVPGALYELHAGLEGYAPVQMTGIVVERARTTTITVVLLPATALREEVRVQARPEAIQLDDAGAGSTYSAEVIDSLPILGRNYQDLLVLAPGVSDVDGDGAPNIHGARDTDVGTLIDGISMADPLTGKGGIELNIESIQEIGIRTAAASAEYGRAQGGFVDIQTKSGGNRFEGTFKFYYRSSALDGDGAGFDDPRLHGGVGDPQRTSLSFHDALPFLSLSGPIVRDRAWFYASFERIRQDVPVNALTQAFVTGVRETRDFLKLTWQATANGRFNLMVTRAPQEFLNQGLDSFTAQETGYTLRSGGTLVSGKHTLILSPWAALETTAGYLDTHPGQIPTTGQDTNGDGRLYLDWNRDGFRDAVERDPGEDYDRDGAFDVFEDFDVNHKLGADEDRDGDRRLTIVGACEGDDREDQDCDGRLDDLDEDKNHNGIIDYGEDRDGDRRLDRGTEDRNGNGRLDDTPYPLDLYPYGRRAPLQSDRDQTVDLLTGTIDGPYYVEFNDRRARTTLRQDLTVTKPDARGTHDLRFGWQVEREEFSRTTEANALRAVKDFPIVCAHGVCGVQVPPGAGVNDRTVAATQPTVDVRLPTDPRSFGGATGSSAALHFTDTWKPIPNLSLGFGLRFDRERITSEGYTPFDPVLEQAQNGRLLGLMGAESWLSDMEGDHNGAITLGIPGDPLFWANPLRAGPLVDTLRMSALRRLTRHHASPMFSSDQLRALLPVSASGDPLTDDLLRQLGVPVQETETFPLTNNNLAPRLSVSWDPAAMGRTKLFATWGRFYDRLFLSTVVGETGPDWLQRYYLFDADGLEGLNQLSVEPARGHPDAHVGTPLALSAPTITQVDRSLQTPWSDELTLGFEREVSPELLIGVRYIRRDFRAQLQDMDLNHSTQADPVHGGFLDEIGRLVHDPLQPQANHEVADGEPDLYIANPFFNQVLRIGNFNQGRYRAVEMHLSRRMSRRWALDASYVYSRATGDAEDFQSRAGNDPSTVEAEGGYLDYDQRHVIKVSGVVFLPHDWQFGAAASWSSGLPYSVVSRFFAFDNVGYIQLRTRYGFIERQSDGFVFHGEPRNARRNAAVTNIDLRVKKAFVLGRTTGAVFLEGFNVLNSDDLTIHSYEPGRSQQTQASSIDPSAGPGDSALIPATGGLQIDGERRFGRRLQIGFQFNF
jgi:hypothetical protein